MKIRALILILLVGCAVIPPCPPEDLYFVHYHSDGMPQPLFVPEGYFDTKDCCKTPEEFEEFVKKYKAYMQEQRELEYERRFGE